MAFIPQTLIDTNPENPIREEECDSSWISRIRYDRNLQQLIVTVRRGDQYQLDGVPNSLADDFFKASSKGQFYNDQLKGRFGGQILVSMKK